MFKIVNKNEKGIGLIEVLIALAILGIVAAAFLSGLATASRAFYIADVRTTAESLARSQMEHVKNQPYDTINVPPVYDEISGIPADFNIVTTAERLDPEGDTTSDDDGLQKITVTVSHLEVVNVKITLEDYKVDR